MQIIRRRQARPDGPTDAEWKWLTGAPGYNPFFGFRNGLLERLVPLWREHEADIRAIWRDNPPAELPYGHPAADHT